MRTIPIVSNDGTQTGKNKRGAKHQYASVSQTMQPLDSSRPRLSTLEQEQEVQNATQMNAIETTFEDRMQSSRAGSFANPSNKISCKDIDLQMAEASEQTNVLGATGLTFGALIE